MPARHSLRRAAFTTVDREAVTAFPFGVRTMPKQFLNPPALNTPSGFTHVVTATGAKTIYVSGQVSVNAKAEVVGKGDFRAQVERTFENLKTALAAAGATFKDVVKVTYFVVGLKPEHVPVVRETRAKHLDAK